MLTAVLQPDQLDLPDCAREPIRIPGSIQPHGVLFVLEDESLVVLQVSANASELFLSEVLGKSLDLVLGAEWASSFRSAIAPASLEGNPLYLRSSMIETKQGQRFFHAIAHRSNGALLLELEFAASEQPLSFPDLYPLVRSFIAELQTVSKPEDLSALAAREVRRITGFDRVLVYAFDPDWNGCVIAEDRSEALESYFDLWFPASDIPQQARELYRLNRLRLIADVGYRPVPLMHAGGSGASEPVDLSFSSLRSVSPVHIEYLKNMGVSASMSISVLREQKLWGLIACHHRTALLVPFEIRTACDFLGQAFALQLAAAEQSADYEKRLKLKLIETRLLTFMAQEEHFLKGLTDHHAELLQLMGATGAAVLFEGQCKLVGLTPPEKDVSQIADWLADHGHDEVFHSDCFATQAQDSLQYFENAVGLLAISISKLYRSFVIWFRPEAIQTLTWSGDPTKPVEQAADGSLRLHPRKSFEAWKQTVRGRSVAWGRTEVEAAGSLRRSLLEIVLRKAEEVAHLNEELKRSNKELEAFSYSVSHDLRAPFRHIAGYSSLLRDILTGHPNKDALRYVNTIIESANLAGSLVDSLLHFSRIGRSPLSIQTVSQSQLVNEVRADIMAELRPDRNISWQVQPLPDVAADALLLRLVWQNLLSNAVKYTRKNELTVIEIGADHIEHEMVFFVRDNGVGFDPRYRHKLFGVFQRLHRMEDFEGNGIGLANVQRIIDRHGGRTWADGAVGQGAAFYFSLPKQQLN